MDPLSIIASTLAILDGVSDAYTAIQKLVNLPEAFQEVSRQLPLAEELLKAAEAVLKENSDAKTKSAAYECVQDCKKKATTLRNIFQQLQDKAKKDAPDGQGQVDWPTSSLVDAYKAGLLRLKKMAKASKVEKLMGEIMKKLETLSTLQGFKTATTWQEKLGEIKDSIEALNVVTEQNPSIEDEDLSDTSNTHFQMSINDQGTGYQNEINHLGSGDMPIVQGGTGHILGRNATINNVNEINNHLSVPPSIDDIYQSCLRALRCPDSFAVKNRLKESKDKLLYKSINWILHDTQYLNWRDGDDVCLLWIKGGAGKGKTMMSIGLIERLSLPRDQSTIVTYFFCQNADDRLNTLEAIIKGLILQLVNQQEELKESLRRRWDNTEKRFDEDMTSWRTLWNIFLEMLHQCKCPRVYVVVDALDECHDNGMEDLLKLIVRTGLAYSSRIKWLLTSRPLDSAERTLLAGSEQVLVSLELNAKHISEAVAIYIACKVEELDKRFRYGPVLIQEIQAELAKRAEDTYLWVNLVCKVLENVRRDDALSSIQDWPPGLDDLYDKAMNQLSKGDLDLVKGCMRLLKVMMLAYRPMSKAELLSVSGLSNESDTVEVLVDRCASFVKMRGDTDIEFNHQSARDYLAGQNGQLGLEAEQDYGHSEITLSCLSYLSQQLKPNIVDLPRPNSTRQSMKTNQLLTSLAYAATFWVRHLDNAKQTMLIHNALAENGEVSKFLSKKSLEWLECLSLLDKLSTAIGASTTLAIAAADIDNPSLSDIVQDFSRFLLRHYSLISTWPLQIYSSAIVFSPQTSIIRINNLNKVPTWFKRLPQTEQSWSSLIQTLVGHSSSVRAVVFSPDGKQIASGSSDYTIKLWDTCTGHLQQTLVGHSDWVQAVVFSPDGKQIASGSEDKAIKLWDTRRGHLQQTLVGHSNWVLAVVFSLDGKQIASGSRDKTIKLWDARTGHLQQTLIGHSSWVQAVVFSLDGKQIASGSRDKTIKLWDTRTGHLQQTLVGHSGWVQAVAFSLDGKQIASGSWDKTIKLWDTCTGHLQQTLVGHSDSVYAVVFSPDGKQIASGSLDKTIKLWDARTGYLQQTLAGSSSVRAVAFSLDGKQIASGSDDKTIKLWDTRTGHLQQTLVGHSSWVQAVAFSLDGKQIASGSWDKTIKLWDARTGHLQQTLVGHSYSVRAVVFSLDGKQIVSGSFDNTIKLWDTRTGHLQQTLADHSGDLQSLEHQVKAVALSSEDWQITPKFNNKIIKPKLWEIAKNKFKRALPNRPEVATSIDESVSLEINRLKLESLDTLKVSQQWICYKALPVFFLNFDLKVSCYDVYGDQIAVGFDNGRVLCFEIDCTSLPEQ